MLKKRELLKKYLFIPVILFVTVLIITSIGCARIGYPSGGPKDTLAPILVRTQPPYGATNFSGDRVSFRFNEYVQLKDANKNFIISPPMEKKPTLSISGKQVRVRFNTPLEENTTYLLNFANSIVDNNEANPYSDFRFVFSTGSYVDSLKMIGLVMDAFTDAPLENIFTYLYEDMSDSVVLNTKPNNISRTDKEGFFSAENLKGRSYKIVALDDKNTNYKYDVGSELIGFFEGFPNPALMNMPSTTQDSLLGSQDSTFMDTSLVKKQPQLTIRMFKEEVKRQYITSATRSERRAFKLTFNAPFPTIDSLAVDSVDLSSIVIEPNVVADTLILWMVDTLVHVPDTLNIKFSYLKTDTLNELSSTSAKYSLIYTSPVNNEDKENKTSGRGIGGFLKGLVGIDEEVEDTAPPKPAHWTILPKMGFTSVSPIQNPTLVFNAPLLGVALDSIKIEELQINPRTKDSSYVRVKYELRRDSINLRLYEFVSDWKENTVYRYQILPETFWDIYSQANDSIQGEFVSVDPDKLSMLTLVFSGVEQQYILQVHTEKDVVAREYIITENMSLPIKYLNAGRYKLKVIKDDNKNGVWDTGSYFEKRQPEYVTYLRNSDGSLVFDLRQGWEMDLSVNVDILFPKLEE